VPALPRVVHGKGLPSRGRSRAALRRARWLKSFALARAEVGGKSGEEAVLTVSQVLALQ